MTSVAVGGSEYLLLDSSAIFLENPFNMTNKG